MTAWVGWLRPRRQAATSSSAGDGDSWLSASRKASPSIPQLLRLASPELLSVLAEDYGAVLAELDHHQSAARLLGAADAMRARLGTPRQPGQEADIAEPFAKARAALPAQDWDEHYQHGYTMTIEDLLTELHANPPAG